MRGAPALAQGRDLGAAIWVAVRKEGRRGLSDPPARAGGADAQRGRAQRRGGRLLFGDAARPDLLAPYPEPNPSAERRVLRDPELDRDLRVGYAGEEHLAQLGVALGRP